MSQNTTSTAFERYKSYHREDRIQCPLCNTLCRVGPFRSGHAKTQHDILPLRKCAYCGGAFAFEEGVDYRHMRRCLENLIRRSSLEAPAERAEETVPICECAHFDSAANRRHHANLSGTRVEEWARFGFYDPELFENDRLLGVGKIPFDLQSGLGFVFSAALAAFDHTTAYHLSVRANAFESFVRRMEPAREVFTLLPWSVLCDGIERDDGERQSTLDKSDVHHRHMIAVVSKRFKTQFETAWNGIRDGTRVHSKLKITIKDRHHLVRTVAYLGSRNASCDGKSLDTVCWDGDEETADRFRQEHHHYLVFVPLHAHSSLWMSTLFDGGLEKYLSDRNKNKSIGPWAQHITRMTNAQRRQDGRYLTNGVLGRYAVPVKHTGVPIAGCRLPLSDRLKIGNAPTNELGGRIYLMNGAFANVGPRSEHERVNLPSDRATRLQMENVFVFLDCVREKGYYLSLNQVKQWNAAQEVCARQTEERDRAENARMGVREREWERKMALVRSECDAEKLAFEDKLAMERCVWDAEKAALEEKVENLENRNIESHEKYCDVEMENSNLKKEKVELEKKCVELKKEIVQLKKRKVE